LVPELREVPDVETTIHVSSGEKEESMAKSVRVHDDTHRALKLLKTRRRSRSIDEVIREMIRASTGSPVEDAHEASKIDELTKYLKG